MPPRLFVLGALLLLGACHHKDSLGPAKTLSIKERIAFVDVGQRFTPTTTATDDDGHAVPTDQLVYDARTPLVVSITPTGVVTGNTAGQTFVIASSNLTRDSVLVVVTNPGGPVLQSDFTRLDVPRGTTFTAPIVLDMRSGDKLGATTIAVRWDPAQLTFVSQAEGANGAGAQVNATGVSLGVLTLAIASVDGLSGRNELRRLTFKADTLAGRTGSLRLSASELSAAGTFADLLPKTSAVTYPLSIR